MGTALRCTVCVLASGSSGNAVLVSDGETHLLVDSGLVAKEVVRRLGAVRMKPEDLSGILITHAHADHYSSAGTLHARHHVPVYIDQAADATIRMQGERTSFVRISKTSGIPPTIGTIGIEAFANSHSVSAGTPMGFVLKAAGARVGIITDTGVPTAAARRALAGCDVLVVEANYDAEIVAGKLRDGRFAEQRQYLAWVASDQGHLSNDQCAELLVQSCSPATRCVFLAHISENHHEADRDNNSFASAESAVRARFRREGIAPPAIHRTYRRGATEGQASRIVVVD